MFCPSCGKELSENAKFCGGCGTPVKPKTSSAASPSAGAAESIPASNAATAFPPASAPAEQTLASVPEASATEAPKEKAVSGIAGFKAAGSGANPFASFSAKAKEATDAVSKAAASGGSSLSGALSDRMSAMNEGAEAKAFNGAYAKTAESEDIAQKAKKAAEDRAARRAATKAKAEERRGKKPLIAGFSDEEETSGPEHAVFASGLPDWDLVPATPFMVDHKAS